MTHAARWMWFLIVVAGFVVACGAPSPDRPDASDAATQEAEGCEATESAVRAAVERLIAADNAEDLEAALSMYTEDAGWLPPGDNPVLGREAIRSRYEAMFGENDVAVAVEILDARVDGDRASVQGTTSGALNPRSGGEPVPIEDSFIMMLECSDEAGWRVSHLAWVPHGEPDGEPGGS